MKVYKQQEFEYLTYGDMARVSKPNRKKARDKKNKIKKKKNEELDRDF
jgi:hypothetical protein